MRWKRKPWWVRGEARAVFYQPTSLLSVLYCRNGKNRCFMEIKMAWMAIIAGITAIAGLFGWSHRGLRNRMTDMEIDLYKKPSRGEIRTLMTDKIRPIEVEYTSLSRRIDELKKEHHKMSDKIDKILVICSRIAHERED